MTLAFVEGTLPVGSLDFYRLMDTDAILQTLNDHSVDYLLIGGVNFLLHHQPVLTYDTDVWVENSAENLARANAALREMQAEWGPTDSAWAPVPPEPAWLQRQSVFCMTTRHGPLDLFREVLGLEGRYAQCRATARVARTQRGTAYRGLGDVEMLACQLALPVSIRKAERVAVLRAALARRQSER